MKDWLNNHWLVEHQTTADEIQNFLALAERDIHDSQTRDLSIDWRFNIAYNAALQIANTALAASGYRVSRSSSHHHYAIRSLQFTLGVDTSKLDLFDRFRKKRNIAEYDYAGTISEQEWKEMLKLAKQIHKKLRNWLVEHHPDLLPAD